MPTESVYSAAYTTESLQSSVSGIRRLDLKAATRPDSSPEESMNNVSRGFAIAHATTKTAKSSLREWERCSRHNPISVG
jgi:hypothetical protein